MALELRQNLKTTQRLSLTTDLKNSITILGLERSELESFLAHELEKNPCLIGLNKTQASSRASHSDNFFSKEIIDNSHKTSLHSHIFDQISMMRLSLYEQNCVKIILQYIDDSGYFTATAAQLALIHSVHKEDLEFAIDLVQKCEPVGIGAHNLQECLLLQASRISQCPSMVFDLLKNHWVDFEKQNVAKIARAVSVSPQEIKESFRFIRDHFDPKPARQFGQEANQVVVPDVYVFKREGQWMCSLNQDGLPKLKLSKRYETLLTELKESAAQKETVKYLNENIRSGKALIRSLEDRNKTILRVADTILKHQKDFFESGADHLVPLTLKDISVELDLHESTISRSTAGKYLYSPRGIFELKYFFNSRMETSDGKELANESIKQWVQEFIKNENKEAPLSDQDLADKIALEKSVKIARRTVSKYRESLGIMSSSKRSKKF